MRPIAPRLPGWEDAEQTIAEDQPEYSPITVAILPHTDGPRSIVVRYTFTADERARIAAGEDVYFAQLNFGGPMTPIYASVGPSEHWKPIEGGA